MCGRYVSPDDAAIERHFHFGRRDQQVFVRRFNVAPSTTVPIIVSDQDGRLELVAARWGFVPHWWKEAKPPNHTFLARSEEASSKPMWRAALRRTRCLVPVEGWYEWKEMEVVDRETGEVLSRKQPFFIFATQSSLVTIAGLYSVVENEAGDRLMSCAVLSKAASGPLAAVHHRMPVVLGAESSSAWLSPTLDHAMIESSISNSETEFSYRAVSTRVNSTRNDDERLVEAPPNAL